MENKKIIEMLKDVLNLHFPEHYKSLIIDEEDREKVDDIICIMQYHINKQ